LQATQVEQNCAWQRIDQQIDVAIVPVGIMQNRTKDAQIRRTKTAYRFAYFASLMSSAADRRIGILSYQNPSR
jgi:hypothetical protein